MMTLTISHTTSTQSQRDVSRHKAVEVEATKLAAGDETLLVFVSGSVAECILLVGRPA